MGPVICNNARARGSHTAIRRRPTRGVGATHRAADHDDPMGGPEQSLDAAATEWMQAAPEPHAGWRGDVYSLLLAPLPPPPFKPRRQPTPSHGNLDLGV